MKTAFWLPVLLLLGSFSFLEAANILCLVSSAKHNNPGWSRPLFDALLAKGHLLTVVSTSESEEVPQEGMVYFHLPNEYDVMQKHFIDKVTGEYLPMVALKQLLVWYEVILGSCRSIIESATLKSLQPKLVAEISQDFDLIITDVTEGANCLLELVPAWDTKPVLGLSAGKLTTDLIALLQAEDTISAAKTPHHLSQVPKNMGFWNRLHNHLMYMGEPIINSLIIRPVLDKIVSTANIFPKLQLVLLNTHPVVDYIQNLPPGVIEVGGLHIKDEVQPLPVSIRKFTEKFIYGTVYINMPYIESIRLGMEAIVVMIQKNPNCGFIWNVKEMGSNMPSKLRNLLTLHVDESLQQDILALPVKAFLTHGDSFSVQEAVFYGVPMVVLPLNLEQFNSAQRVKERHLGVTLSATEIHFNSFMEGLHLIHDDEHFTTVLYQAQQKFRSRPLSPIEIAVWHAEQMIAEPRFYKDLAQVDQNFFVAHSLDVLAVPILLLLCFVLNLLHVIPKVMQNPKKKELKKRRKIKVVEKKDPENKTLLEENTPNKLLLEEYSVNKSLLERKTVNKSLLEKNTEKMSPLEQKTLNKALLKLKTINKSLLEQKTVNKSLLEQKTVNKSLLEKNTENTLEQKTLNKSPLKQKTVNKSLLEQVTLNKSPLKQKAVNKSLLEQKTMNKSLLEQKTVNKSLSEQKTMSKSLLGQNSSLMEDLNDEMIEGEIEFLAANQSHNTDKSEEPRLPSFITSEEINKDWLDKKKD